MCIRKWCSSIFSHSQALPVEFGDVMIDIACSLCLVLKGSDFSLRHARYFENIVQSNMYPSMFICSLNSPEKNYLYYLLIVIF